jgi:hypothetical protein
MDNAYSPVCDFVSPAPQSNWGILTRIIARWFLLRCARLRYRRSDSSVLAALAKRPISKHDLAVLAHGFEYLNETFGGPQTVVK